MTKQSKSTSETPGAQLHMLSNIPVKFHDARWNTFWAMCNTNWKLQIFTKLRTISLQILNKSTQKYPGAQLHMLINIPVKFHDPRSNTFWTTCESWKLQILSKSKAITFTIHHRSLTLKFQRLQNFEPLKEKWIIEYSLLLYIITQWWL
jgi:RNase H-fold protein (predicted Holliday junction resolvase)